MSDEQGDYLPPDGEVVGFNFKKPYVKPDGNNIGFNFKYLWYHPPKGNQIAFDFITPYIPPQGNEIGFNFTNNDEEETPVGPDQYIFPNPFDALTFGVPEAKLYTRYIESVGFNRLSIGAAKVWNWETRVKPTSLNTAIFGSPVVYNFDREIKPSGLHASLFSAPAIISINRYLNIVGFNASAYGQAQVQSLRKYVNPTGFHAVGMGIAATYNRKQEIKPSGLHASLFSPPAIISINRYLNIVGFNPAVYGQAQVKSLRAYLTVTGRNFTVLGQNIWVDYKHRPVMLVGVNSLSYGQHNIGDRAFYPKPAGLDATLLGQPRLLNRNRYITPSGFIATGYGGARAYNLTTVVLVPGVVYGLYGQTVLQLGTRYVHPYGVYRGAQYGNAWVSLGRRTVASVTFNYNPVFGQNIWVGYKHRPVMLAGVNSLRYGQHSISDRAFYPKSVGLDATLWGRGRVDNEHRTYYISGITTPPFGTTSVRNNVRYLYPRWIFSFSSGYGGIGDAIRYLRDAAGGDNFLSGARHLIGPWHVHAPMRGFTSSVVGVYTTIADARQTIKPRSYVLPDFFAATVENQDRYVQPVIFWSPQVGVTLYGRPQVESSTRTLHNMVIPSVRFGLGTTVHFYVGDIDQVRLPTQAFFGDVLIADRIRLVRPGILAPTYVSSLILVRNAARALLAAGFDAASFGAVVPELKNRSVKVAPILSGTEVYPTRPYISDGVRSLDVGSIRGSSYVAVGGRVWLGTRFISAASVEPPRVLRYETEVVSRFNIVKQLWTQEHVDMVSKPLVANRKRILKTWMVDQTEYGRVWVELSNREFEISAGNLLSFGPVRISDRTLKVNQNLYGIRAPELVRQRIEKLMLDPPHTRKIELTGIYVFMWDPTKQLGVPTVGLQLIENVGLRGAGNIGEASVFNNSIIMEFGILNPPMGAATVSPFYIRPTGLDNKIQVGAYPGINPYHIFAAAGDMCPGGYTPYSRTNVGAHTVDGRMYSIPGYFGSWDITKNAGGWVPQPIVTHWIQNRAVGGGHLGAMGYTSIFRVEGSGGQTQYIKCRGFSELRVGWLRFPPDTAYSEGWPSQAFGRLSMRRVQERVTTSSFSGVVLGKPVVDFYHRFVKPTGIKRDVFGTAWGAYRVRGFKPVGISYKGVVVAPRISFLNRVVGVPGGDYLNPYAPLNGSPLKVRNRYNGWVLNPKSLALSALPVPDIGFWTKWIQPRGMFAIPVSRAKAVPRATIYALGTEHSVFGTVRKWEEGVVYPHELVSSSVTSPRVTGTKLMQGFSGSLVNYPTIAGHIGAYGTPKETFGATVVENEVCCGGCG